MTEEIYISHHDHTLFAEPIASIGGFIITNSLLNSWLALLVIIIFCYFLKKRITYIPKGIQNFFEIIMEKFLDIFDSITGSREMSFKFLPLVLSFFILILINNWLGIMPGVGSVGQVVLENEKYVFIPYFRGGTADLNTTLALATIGVVISHIFGVIALGFWRHFNKFINLQAILEIPGKIRKNWTVIIVNPIKLLIGLVEIIGEMAKVASLSFRLFGNIFAGEVLLASMSAIFAFGLPIPFLFLEILIGLIQALIFSMLILVYLHLNTAKEEH